MGTTARRLVVALPFTRLGVRARGALVLPYAASMTSRVTLTGARGGRVAFRVRGTARAGANRVRFRAPRRPGRYRLALVAVGGGSAR